MSCKKKKKRKFVKPNVVQDCSGGGIKDKITNIHFIHQRTRLFNEALDFLKVVKELHSSLKAMVVAH